jgi:hypothetical protein
MNDFQTPPPIKLPPMPPFEQIASMGYDSFVCCDKEGINLKDVPPGEESA